MTYNFDAERWYADRREWLERRHEVGELDQRGFEDALADLDRRYEQMLDRLDGSFTLPE